MNQKLLIKLQDEFPEIPRSILEKALESLSRDNDYYDRITRNRVVIIPKKFNSLEEIEQDLGISTYGWEKTSKDNLQKLFSEPKTYDPVEVVLVKGDYPKGKDGYSVLDNSHPSILLQSISFFTKEKLTEMGVAPSSIVLPTPADQCFETSDEVPGFLCCYLDKEKLRLGLKNKRNVSTVCATLLQKK